MLWIDPFLLLPVTIMNTTLEGPGIHLQGGDNPRRPSTGAMVPVLVCVVQDPEVDLTGLTVEITVAVLHPLPPLPKGWTFAVRTSGTSRRSGLLDRRGFRRLDPYLCNRATHPAHNLNCQLELGKAWDAEIIRVVWSVSTAVWFPTGIDLEAR